MGNRKPKGPFRTKNATTIAKIVKLLPRSVFTTPPRFQIKLLRRGPFSERENVSNSQENGVCTRCAAIVNHRALVKILRVVNLLRVVFLVRRGPLQGGGGGHNVSCDFGEGEERTIECPLQNHVWRLQKVGFVWSVRVSSKEDDMAWTKGGGGKRIIPWAGPRLSWKVCKIWVILGISPHFSPFSPVPSLVRKYGNFRTEPGQVFLPCRLWTQWPAIAPVLCIIKDRRRDGWSRICCPRMNMYFAFPDSVFSLFWASQRVADYPGLAS